MSEAPKILIVAQNASSVFGGEAFLPLKYFQLMRQRGLPVKLIAHSRNRANLTETLAPWLEDIYFIEDSRWHRFAWNLGKMLPGRISSAFSGALLNFINERFQKRLVRSLIRAGDVDIIHQPIPVSPLTPSSLYGLGVPVVIGPMNGGMTYPEGYEYLQGRSTRRFIRLARGMARALNNLIPGKRKATTLLVANKRTRDALEFLNHPNVIDLVENGVDFSIWHGAEPVDQKPRTQPFRLVFLGRLVDWKAVDVTLEAIKISRSHGTSVTLDIIGDGDEREALERLAQAQDLTDAVRFYGFLPQSTCAERLKACDALILNSVYECGGAVVLEAMSLGLPVIASNWGGPADYLDSECGILVEPVPKKGFSDRLATAITQLADNPELRQRMGAAGSRKVREQFDWERKVDRILDIYADAIARHPTRQHTPDHTDGPERE